jgi:hypothetical protein
MKAAIGYLGGSENFVTIETIRSADFYFLRALNTLYEFDDAQIFPIYRYVLTVPYFTPPPPPPTVQALRACPPAVVKQIEYFASHM